MDMKEQGLYAEIAARVSMLVYAGGKSEAVLRARTQLSDESIRLLKVKMIDRDGKPCWFRVEAVHAIDWEDALWSGYSGKYMVAGEIRLTINSSEERESGIASLRQTAYELPRSILNDLTHWSVPSAGGPVFLCVQSYELKWRSQVEIPAWSMVG
ncbi:hypothetical protein [Gorillibacterium sp. sgz5001074]|uniref:hypothetical protein n=1 Tax=Gorillibacterium sp. sgz5001074 TaxID=3446695 RepID=UPI003F66B55A